MLGYLLLGELHMSGLLALSAGYLVILIWLPIAIWIAIKLTKHLKARNARIAAAIGIFAALFVVPFADEIAGRLYFSHLCATEAGVKVYQTVELPKEHWDEAGRARFYVNFDLLLGKTYSVKYKPGTYSSFFHIDNAGYVYVNKLSGQVLGEAVDFGYWGGWMRRNLSAHNTATGCINYTDPSNRLIDRIFIPE